MDRGTPWMGKQLGLLRLPSHEVSWVLFPVPHGVLRGLTLTY